MKYYFKKGYSGTKIIEDFTIEIERDGNCEYPLAHWGRHFSCEILFFHL